MNITTPVIEELRLGPDELRHRLDPDTLPFQTTAEVDPLENTMGQPRALDAIQFGLESPAFGYNMFVTGAPGSGRMTTLRHHAERFARTRPTPDDWVYVNDFEHQDRPQVIRLPAGRGPQLASDMERFIEAAKRVIAQAFETERYEQRRREAHAHLSKEREELLDRLQAFAHEHGFGLEVTPQGILALPVRLGRVMPAEEIQKLPEEQRHELERRGQEVQVEIVAGLRRQHQLEREVAERIRQLDREVALFAIDPLMHGLRERYAAEEEVLSFLEHIREDVPDHLADFRAGEGGQEAAGPLDGVIAARPDHLDRYRVNVLVAQSAGAGAPVVLERNPTYYNLIGRVEYRATFGTMITDFHQVKAGALHRANGGFLLLEALDVLQNPFAWEALKRALRSREVRIENLGEQLSAVPTATLRPEPVPIDVKVVVLGSPALYQLLYSLDEDFHELFKVKVEFSPDMEWTDEHVREYAAFISRCVREDDLRHFDRSAVAAVVEHASRLREHQRKLSSRLLDVVDVVTEASFWAGKAGHEVVLGEDVRRAIDERERRSNLAEEQLREMIGERTIRIETEGSRVGQVNGLTVVELGDHRFGLPSRVTARVALGRGTIESIEREIDLSGPIHSKGVLILSGYLLGQYGQSRPLSVRATLTFEQSYQEVEGDSASSTELYALLSALSGLPVSQSIAVTGSVDQHGEVQAVGGVTQKIEGFFAVCRERGLTGEQGVVMPATNVKHLMLSDEVLEAVRQGRFHVWAVKTIDEGIEILCGRRAGERQPDGRFPKDSVHRLVEDRLRAYSEQVRAFGTPPNGTRAG